MAQIQIDLKTNDGVTRVVEQIEKKFDNLQRRAEKLGTSLDEGTRGGVESLKNIGESYSLQLKYIESLKKEISSLASRRKELLGKHNNITAEETQELHTVNKRYDSITESIKEEKKALKQLESAFRETFDTADKSLDKSSKSLDKVKEETRSLDSVFGKAAKGAAALFTVDKAIDFAKKVVNVRGEMQMLTNAFSSMLGSKEKAQELMDDAIQFAATTPFDLQGVAAGAKQLLAYGTEQKNIISDMKMLGSVAAGLSVPLNDLIYLYGTLRAQGRVMTIDIRQFAMRGIPIYDELAKVLGVAKDQINGIVSSGGVTFEHVEQAFKNMTSAGGKFAGLMDGMAKTVNGRISNIQDAIYQMFNKIGEKSDGLINAGLSITAAAIDNVDKIGKVLETIITIYGSYKAAVIAVTAAQQVNAALVARNAALEIAAQNGVTAAYMRKIAALRTIVKLRGILNKTKLGNPYVLAASAVVGLSVSLVKAAKEQDKLYDSEQRYQSLVASRKDLENQEAEVLQRINESANKDARVANVDALIRLYPGLLDMYKQEELYLMSITQLQEATGKAQKKQEEDYISSLVAEKKRLEEERKGYTAYDSIAINENVKRQREIAAELEAWQRLRPDLFDMGPAVPDGVRKTKVEDKLKNKTYWEKQKKDAEGKLNQMTISELNSKQGEEQKKLYNEAVKMLEKYDFASKKATMTLESNQKKKIKILEDFNDKMNEMSADIQYKTASLSGNKTEQLTLSKEVSDMYRKAYEYKQKISEFKEVMGDSDKDKRQLKTMQESYENIIKLINEYDKVKQASIAKEQAEDYEKLLGENGVLSVQMTSLEKEYITLQNKLLSKMTKENAEIVGKALDNLSDTYMEQMQGLYSGLDVTKFSNPDFIKSLEGRTTDSIAEELANLEILFDSLTKTGVLSEEEAIDMAGKIKILTEALKGNSYGVKEETDSWTTFLTVLNDVGSSLNSLASDIGGPVGDMLKNIGGISTSFGKGVVAFRGMRNATSSLEKFTSGLSLFGAAAEIVLRISSIYDEHREAMRKLTDAAEDYSNALIDIERQQRRELMTNAFGTDDFALFLDNVEKAKNAFNDVAQKYQGKKQWLSITSSAGKKYETGFNSGELWSDMRSGFQKLLGIGQKNLIGVKMSEFFDSEGNLIGEKLRAWYEAYGEGLSDYNKRMVEDMLEAWDEYKETTQEITNFVSNLVGDVLNSAAEQMYDNFIKTGSAISDMSQYLQDFQKNLAVSTIKSLLFDKVFKGAQEELVKKLENKDTQGAIDLMSELLAKSEEYVPEIQKFLEGLNLNLQEAQDATAGGFQTMSQDLGTELNGRFTAIQLSNEAIRGFLQTTNESILDIKSGFYKQYMAVDDIRRIQADALLELMSINENTALMIKPIKEMNFMVGRINEKVSKL